MPPEYSIGWVDLLVLAAGQARWWLADRVLMKIFYLLLRWLFGLAVLAFRGDQAKDAELLVLRHENAVLRLARWAGAVRASRPGLVRRAGPVHPAEALGRSFP